MTIQNAFLADVAAHPEFWDRFGEGIDLDH